MPKPLQDTRFPDTTTPRTPHNRGKPPNIIIIPRSEDGHDAGPKDGRTYFGLDRPFHLPPHCGKAEDRPRERL